MRCLFAFWRASVEFTRNKSGSVALTSAVAILVLIVGVGSALDLGRAVLARQKLSQSAQNVCQYASKASVAQLDTTTDNGAAYISKVTNYVPSALKMQLWGGSQTNATPFAYSEGGPGNVQFNTSVPTTFMQIINVQQIPVVAKAHCFDANPNAGPAPPSKPSPGQTVMSEGFENSACSGTCWTVYAPGVAQGSTISSPSNSFPKSATYTGSGGAAWYVMGYCLEVDTSTLIFSSATQGTHSVELDCDNGQGTAGNSSISTQIYLYAGTYELRWSYQARIAYADYTPVPLCANAASDLSWANDTNSASPTFNALRTNQVNVYLDYVANASSSPPTHWTIDSSQQLAGSNLIDMCVYSSAWIQRSVKITVTQAGYYWLSFAADGQNDSYGGSIDNLMVCYVACSGSVSDNFPAAWLAANNGGANKVLFQDTFGSPGYVPNIWLLWPWAGSNTGGNVQNSTGTSGASNGGWPNSSASGWYIGPYNQITYIVNTYSGWQALQLDATGGSAGSNKEISRPFLLAPGYYQVSYQYASGVQFSGKTGTYCGSTPSAAGVPSFTGNLSGTDTISNVTKNYPADTNMVGIFMSHAQLASNPKTTSYGTATTYTNPDGTTSATPTAPSNSISLTSYNASQNNPLLDMCAYYTYNASANFATRTANIKITKPAYYWLTASALGTADSYGGWINNVTLTALGSSYMASPPSGAITIPVPAPQPGSSLSLPSTLPDYSIAADVFAP